VAQLRASAHTRELRERGWRVNPKRVHRLMREDNLLCVRRRKFVVTTDSNHIRKVYPNLARDMILTAIRSTVARRYHLHPAARRVRVPRRDSGRVLAPRDRLGAGSHDGRRTHVDGAAHGARAPRVEPGLVHHSDRGSQYASNDYTDLLKANGIEISMSRKGNPWDNAACESFMKTLKYEEVLRNEYRDLADARASIREFLEKIYNEKRLHSALGYMPPARVRSKPKGCRCAAAFCMSFPRHQEIFPSEGGASLRPTPLLIVWMSFRPAIPWRVGLHQSPPPLHQPGTSML
jgi:putative transposase